MMSYNMGSSIQNFWREVYPEHRWEFKRQLLKFYLKSCSLQTKVYLLLS